MCVFNDAAAQRGLYYPAVCKAMTCDSCPWQLVGGAVVLGCSLFSELGGGKDSEGEGKSEAP